MRRIGVVLLAVVTMFGALIVGGGALSTAHEATPATSAEHPFVGGWAVDVEPENPDNLPNLSVVSSDGTLVDLAVDGPAVGI